jgi:uncharacterized protein (DUF302 family)
MIFTHKPKLDCKSIEKIIENDAKEIALMLKHTFPFSQNLPQNGFEINEYASVFELCRGSVAQNLLNTQPELNILMPCRISVYEKDGVSYVSTPDLTVQLEILGCNEELKKDILGLYEDIKSMIEKW